MLERPMIYEDPEVDVAMLWAQLDGCEGGDFLEALCAAASMAPDGHGYNYMEGDGAERALKELIRGQVNAMRAAATGPDPSMGWDQAAARELVELEQRLRQSADATDA